MLARILASLRQPRIPVQAKNVKVLHSPNTFYNTLLEMIGRAQRRIHLSSLYIGASELLLLKSLRDSLLSNSHLHVNIHLDLLRSTRPGSTSTALALLPLVSEFPERFHVHLFKSPKLRPPLSYIVPRRIDEGWGTWHAKSYIVDDDIILSGQAFIFTLIFPALRFIFSANLNESYFTDRQDRYLYFTSSPHLSNYCVDFLRVFSDFSFKLRSGINETPVFHWPNPKTDVKNLENSARKHILDFHTSWENLNTSHNSDTIIFPMIQAGYMDVRQEEHCLDHLFLNLSHLSNASSSIIDLTSGYFALHKSYQDLIINSLPKVNILAAGPQANGFFGSEGISNRIPEGYILLLRRFWERVMQAHGAQSSTRVEISEWEKDNWTYHAKGLWYRPSISDPPELTLFGSTNLNSRSANLDTELSFLMCTSSPDLRTQLDEEVCHLKKNARTLQKEDWESPNRRVRIGTRMLIAGGIGNYL